MAVRATCRYPGACMVYLRVPSGPDVTERMASNCGVAMPSNMAGTGSRQADRHDEVHCLCRLRTYVAPAHMKSILIVAADTDARATLAGRLEQDDYLVMTAADADEAR